MAQKTLHGKRHLRARRTVQAGREKRFLRKFKRDIHLFGILVKETDFPNIMRNMINALMQMNRAAIAFGQVMAREIPKLTKAFQEVNYGLPKTNPTIE